MARFSARLHVSVLYIRSRLFSAFRLLQQSLSEVPSESVAEARRIKRQRKLDNVEIPEEHLSITNELLGKGGFGEVYLADYNGHNAAAKVRNGLAGVTVAPSKWWS